MEIKTSNRLNSITSYAFAEIDAKVAELKQAGIEPIDFGVGDPKEVTPEIVRNAVKKYVDVRKNSGYPSYIGSEEYRQEIAKWTRKRFGVNLDYKTEINSTIGAKEAVFNFPEAFVNPGDYAIVPNPAYPPYVRGALFAEGRLHYLPLLEKNDFMMDLGSVPKEIARKARIMWINYPNNPTGAVATGEFFREAVDFGHDNGIIIASDECYSEIYFKKKPSSILEYSREGVVVFQSLSKRSAMTGYRVGWIAGDERVISAFRKLKPNIDSGTATFIEDAAGSALRDEKHVEGMRNDYKKKAEILVDAFTSIGWQDCMPDATLYLWQKVPDNMDSVDFAKKLLRKELAIVATPGSMLSATVNSFNPGRNYIRFALVPTMEEAMEAAKRIRRLR